MASPGTSPAGSTNDPPACSSRAAKRLAPILSGTAHRHRALEIEVEILRRIAAETDGTILDQGVGMNEAVLEAEPIDERLQRRARRAHCRCHIDLAGAARVEIVRRGDAREHLAGRMIDGEDRNRHVGPERAGALARKLL